MSSSTETQITYIDICSAADMEILLTPPQAAEGGQESITYIYRVSSQQLCAGSPVFAVMLDPKSSFLEATQLRAHKRQQPPSSELYQLNLSDSGHDPTALAAVFYALHGANEHLPQTIPFEGLCDIAVVCDYYDCADAMRPWVQLWMEPWKVHAERPGYERWLLIAWVFGEASVFEALTKRFIRNGSLIDGELNALVLVSAGPDCDIPHAIIDALSKEIIRIGESLVPMYLEVYKRYEDNTKSQCLRLPGSRSCDDFIFGRFHRGLKDAKLLEDTQCLTLQYIVNAVNEILNSISVGMASALFDGQSHSRCVSSLEKLCLTMEKMLAGSPPISLASIAGGKQKTAIPGWDDILSGSGQKEI
ncbi:hypothetical protein FN846DRAFT_1020383 [Sphaerosporella brunnea]|uniref:BTB domain-containing protein n=1 Tax=Sphaerosporella brunnea TaxID=1250544 RepID=A0A5J5F171_9PEZI|nr:hypothetical protein FN846DRAFT_1020383 [Sphaerosporella brunnea]